MAKPIRQRRRCLVPVMLALAVLAAPRHSTAQPLSAQEIVERVYDEAGGELWRRPKTLALSGTGYFYGNDDQVTVADTYRMWRVFEAERRVAHGPVGLVRIDSFIGKTAMFQISFDGENSWNEKGLIPAETAARYWSNAFGFGIIRRALDPGFSVTRRPDDHVAGQPAYFIEVTSPDGATTLFGIDKAHFRIRSVAFTTPRGWHRRLYEDFKRLDNGWLQPTRVTLYYNGVKANTIVWDDAAVNTPLAPELFRLDQN